MPVTLPRGSSELRRRRFVHGSALTGIAALVAALVVAAPPSADASRARPSVSTAPFGVGLARCTFVDHSRDVLNYRTTPYRIQSRSRTLVTEIRYPTTLRPGSTESSGPPIPRSGGYPTVLFAHGYDVTPDVYAALLDAWVRAGFVVVAPIFPDENPAAVAAQHGANTENDLLNEPEDLAFVTNAMLQASAVKSANCPIAYGLIQPSAIALAGHSDGADAVGMLAYDHGVNPQAVNYAALRTGISYRAVLVFSGAEDTQQSYADEASRPNLLVVQSRDDLCNPMHMAVQLYDAVHQANKWFLELMTAHHLPPFDGVDASAFSVVSTTTIRFLQLSLEGATSTSGLLALGNQRPTTARMFMNSVGSALAHVPPVHGVCGPN